MVAGLDRDMNGYVVVSLSVFDFAQEGQLIRIGW
jgi:hypothetical protein